MLTILEPREKQSPLLISVPHAGEEIPAETLPSFTDTNPFFLTSDSDLYVDKLYNQAAKEFGAILIATSICRYVIDLNRDGNAVDASFLHGAPQLQTPYPLGLVAHKTMSGKFVIKRPLTRSELKERIEKYYKPFHEALRRGIDNTVKKFGFCLHIDAHSMPSVGCIGHHDCGKKRPDVDLADCNSQSSGEKFMTALEVVFKRAGLKTTRNDPYQGGFIAQHYGRPEKNVHTVMIELNRALYMDERAHTPIKEKFTALQKIIAALLHTVCALTP